MSFIKSFKGFYNFLKLKKQNPEKKTICIYSESKNYRYHFEEIINNLENLNKYNIFYLTSDLKDCDLFVSNLKPIFIGDGIIRIIFFTILSCDMMIMTLSDLGNHEIKKSKNCMKYLYIFHSMCSTFKSYRKKAFDNYDIIFANGDHQVEEIKKNEQIYSLKKKEIYNIGYPYLEYLRKKIVSDIDNNTILFAPSWSNNQDLLENKGLEIIGSLLKKNKVVLRPHPQSFIKSKKTIKSIFKIFNKNENFTLNSDITDLNDSNLSSILIADNGGVCMEYYTLYKRPFIYIDYKEKIHNEDYKQISELSLEEKFKHTFGVKIDINSIDKLDQKIENCLKKFVFEDQKLNNFYKSNGIQFSNSARKGCEKIDQILSTL